MFDPARGTVVSWLLQVTYSKSLNRRNRQNSARRPARVEIDMATRIADPEMCPDRTTEKLYAGNVVRLALMELTEAQRETLWLYFFQGYSLLEVSRKRNEGLGNTRHRFYRGMAALRSVISRLDWRGLQRHRTSGPPPCNPRQIAQSVTESGEMKKPPEHRAKP
jgi:RNA polymerase sigma-70 factor, ECF subfamily